MNDNDRYVVRRAIAQEIRQARKDRRDSSPVGNAYYTGKIQALWALVRNHTEFQRY